MQSVRWNSIRAYQPGRHHSLAWIIGISYDALDSPTQSSLAALALFPPKPNTFSEIAASQITGHSPAIVKELVDRRLVDEVRAGRYTSFTNLIGISHRSSIKNEITKARFAEFFLSHLAESPQPPDISSEVPNIRKALALAREQDVKRFEGGSAPLHSLPGSDGSLSTAVDYLPEADATADARHAPAEKRAKILAEHGTDLFRLGSYGDAETKLQAALDLAPAAAVASGIF